MSNWLKQNTAASLVVGPFVVETDGYTSSESLTALSGTMFKQNAASTAINPTVTHTASGYYNLPIASGSADTLGHLRFSFSNSASHLPVWEDFTVVPANTYDSLVGGTDRIDAELAGSGIAASTFGASAVDGVAISATGANKIADHLYRREWGDAASSVDGDGTSASFRTLLGAVAKQVNKLDITSGSLQIYEADDSTILGVQGVTACAAASPIVTLDTT